ncbi:MAG: beta-ketoacyl-ACP synthase 3 [Solirubrobacterales bacterium]
MPELASASLDAVSDDARTVRDAAIASVAMCVPDRVIENAPIAERIGVDPSWITKRTGVERRRIAWPEERLSAFAAEAGQIALERAGVAATEVDLILVATMAADDLTPNAAPLVAEELGARAAGAVDVGAACTGFLSALSLATAQVESRRADNVLVIGADLLSRITDPTDRATAALLADGAGAALVRPAGAAGRIGPVVLGADGAHSALITASHADRVIRMNGHDTFKHAVARMSRATLEALALAGRELDDVDLFVYHQANSRIIRAVGEVLSLPPERTADYLAGYGNTSAATLPMALTLAEEEGRLHPGSVVLLAAFGAGLAWGATVVEWGGPDA